MAKQAIKATLSFIWQFFLGRINFIHPERCKRFADMLEKTGVAGVAVGAFQGNIIGFYVGIPALIFSMLFTQRGQ